MTDNVHDAVSNVETNEYKLVDIELLHRGKYQPRTKFNDSSIQEMATSIERHGILQPILVRPMNGMYEIIAGERRFIGAQRAGMTQVPVIIKEVDDQETLQIALIENIQREDISVVDKANGIKRLLTEFSFTQRQIGEMLGMSRPAVANTLRLLDLPTNILDALHDKRITEGHARSLIFIKDDARRNAVLKRIVEKRISVRETEQLVKRIAMPTEDADGNYEMMSGLEIQALERLREFFGTKIKITKMGDGGRIEIEYYGEEDLERICDVL